MLVCLRLLATFVGGSLMIVAGLVLADKALTPVPRPADVHPRDKLLLVENEHLQREVLRLRGDLAGAQADAALFKIRCEELMRVAVFPPAPAEVRAGDMIPPQNLPVLPEE